MSLLRLTLPVGEPAVNLTLGLFDVLLVLGHDCLDRAADRDHAYHSSAVDDRQVAHTVLAYARKGFLLTDTGISRWQLNPLTRSLSSVGPRVSARRILHVL